MRRYAKLFGGFALVLVVGLGFRLDGSLSEPLDKPAKPAFAPGRILVKVEERAPANAIEEVNRENDARLEEEIPHSEVSVVDLPRDLSVAEAMKRYEASPDVEYAEPDYLLYPQATPNDPSFPNMYNLNNTGQYGGIVDSDIDAPEAWNVTVGNAGTVVAVIDTGVDINHPDLDANIWTNPDEVAGNNKDDDGNGYVDDVHGWDFVNEDASVFDGSGDGHGTHVSGTIAAEGNSGVGITGINWRAQIMPLKFIGATGHVSDAVEALNYAVAEGAKISNNSYGYYDNCGGCYAQTLRDAIVEADKSGHLFVAAAGNGGADYTGDDNGTVPLYPASYGSHNIVSVAATNQEDALTSFSNYGATTVDLGAPGKSILSTVPGNGYGYGEGTSMATPHVAGAAALVLSQNPGLDAEGIKARILGSVDTKASLQGKLLTGGRLNVAKALGASTAPVSPAPVISSPFISTPQPTGRIRDRTPIIRATVRHVAAELAKHQIRVYLDGHQKGNFSFNTWNGSLYLRPGRLSYRRHTVRVVVQYGQGLEATRTSTFWVVRHR